MLNTDEPPTRGLSDLSPRWMLLALLLAVSCFYANLAKDSYMDDFRAFWLASVTQHQGLDPYVNHLDRGEQFANSLWVRQDSLFIYPPSSLFFFVPLHYLPYNAAKLAFGALMALLMVGILMALHRRFPRQTLVLFALFLTLPMIKSVDNGNIDVLILALMLSAFWLEDGWLAGTLLGVAIAIKLAPVLCVAWFISRKRWRTAVWSVVSSGVLMGVAFARWGGGYFHEFFDHMAHHEAQSMPVLQHVFTSIVKIKDRALITPDGIYAYQHDICGYAQNPLHVLGSFAAPVGGAMVLGAATWLFCSKRGRAMTAEQSFFTFLAVVLLINPLLWPMGLVACFPLAVLLVDESKTPNLTALLVLVPFLLTKQIVGNWNFGLWLMTAGWCWWQQFGAARVADDVAIATPIASPLHA